MQDGHETTLDLERSIYYVPEKLYRSEQDKEVENLWKQIKELEIEIRGQHRRRDREGSSDDLDYIEGSTAGSYHRSDSQQLRDRSNKTVGRHSDTPKRDKREHSNTDLEAMTRLLRRATRSLFSNEIKCTEMPRHFNRPLFTCYDGETDLVEHVNYYIQMMSLYYWNDELMCKVFPSSLGPTAMRWFNSLRKRSINNFGKLIQAFRAWLSPAVGSFNRLRHCYPRRGKIRRLFSHTRIGTGSCTTK